MFKRSICLILALLLLGGCAKKPDKPSNDNTVTKCNVSAQYIRTNGEKTDINYPKTIVINSKTELDNYYQQNRKYYDLEHRDKVYSDSTIGFIDAIDKYDDEYFENQSLIMVIIEEPSGSNRHEITKVELFSNGELFIYINKILPEMGTDDMAMWHILIEPTDIKLENNENIRLFMNGKKQTEYVEYSHLYSNISIEKRAGWVYDVLPQGEDESFIYSINLYPEGKSGGKIKIAFNEHPLGLCGTGLESVDSTLGNQPVKIHTYDQNSVWDIIAFDDCAGHYTILNENASVCWDEYGVEAMKILDTLKVGKGIVDKVHVLNVAKNVFEKTADDAKTKYDYQSGIWTVTLGEDSIQVRANGALIEN